MSSTGTATMTSSIPRGHAPPNIPLPPLPVGKTRDLPRIEMPRSSESQRESSGLPSPATRRSATASPSVGTRSVTLSAIPSPKSANTKSTLSIPTLAANGASPSSAIPTPGRTLRKTVSIEAFPQPPKAPRLSSLPPGTLSTSLAPDANAPPSASERGASPLSSRSITATRKLKPKTSAYGLRNKNSTASLRATSLLASGGETRSVSNGVGTRVSDSLLGPPSLLSVRPASPRESLSNEGSALSENGDDSATRRTSGYDTAMDGKGNVTVSVRVRPDAGSGEGANVEGEWMVDGRRSLVSFKGREGGEYRYDNVFSAHDNNARVYDSAAKRMVRRVMEGYNGTVFAYGMTGTGKTFSMQGTAVSPGVIPLAITDIFSYIREKPNREFLLRVSYLEIYNEKIFDLLTPASGQQEEIKLREDSKRGVYATPLKEEIVQSPNQLLRVIARGDQARRVAGTQFNARSSRSHAVVQIVVESRERGVPSGADNKKNDKILPGGVLVSTLSLIDLAGSEKAAENKERRTEGSHINKSLLTLGTVIARLSTDKDGKESADNKDQKHLPYRDSKLTRLLQPALSGNSLVSILCTVQLSSAGTSAAATSSHTAETLNTLKFASRAKNNIVSHAKRNVSDSVPGADAGSRALLDRYRIEIAELRQQLEDQNKAKVEPEKTEEEEELWRERKRESEERHEEQMLEMQLARTALKERISHLNRLILSSKSVGVNSNSARFSGFSTASVSTSMPQLHRVSTSSAVELANSRRQSTVSYNSQSELIRTVSAGSITMGMLPAAATSQIELASASEDEDGEADSILSSTGKASKDRQIRALQADLSDKNRYIATLEKRLIQARRSSHGRTSMAVSPQPDSTGGGDDHDAQTVLREKDREIEELRAQLDDQVRMVTALRSAARKRDMLDGGRYGDRPACRQDAPAAGAAMTAGKLPNGQRSSSRPTSSKSAGPGASHASQHSCGSSVQNFSRHPLTPVAVPNNEEGRLSNGIGDSHGTSVPGGDKKRNTRQSVDEMTKLLDEMIQEKVAGGQAFRGERGSLRVKRDTIMEKIEQETDVTDSEAEQMA